MGVEQSFIDFVESSKGFGFDFKSSGSPLNGVKQNVTRSVLCFKMIILATLWKID